MHEAAACSLMDCRADPYLLDCCIATLANVKGMYAAMQISASCSIMSAKHVVSFCLCQNGNLSSQCADICVKRQCHCQSRVSIHNSKHSGSLLHHTAICLTAEKLSISGMHRLWSGAEAPLHSFNVSCFIIIQKTMDVTTEAKKCLAGGPKNANLAVSEMEQLLEQIGGLEWQYTWLPTGAVQALVCWLAATILRPTGKFTLAIPYLSQAQQAIDEELHTHHIGTQVTGCLLQTSPFISPLTSNPAS